MAELPFDLSNPATYTLFAGAMRRNYNYRVAVTSVSPSGLPSIQHITVASNQILTEEQILGTAASYTVQSKYEKIVGAIADMEVVEAVRSSGTGGLGSAISSLLE